MNNFVHLTSQKLLEILNNYDSRSIFFVHGKESYKTSGAKNIFDQVFKIVHSQQTEYYDFSVNPKIEDIKRGLLLFKSKAHTLIIGLGGGSVLDTAKLIRFFSAYSGDPVLAQYKKIDDTVPLILFPTTAGTGSEATHFAVCYINKKKYSISHPDIFPNDSYIDYRFTLNNPPYLTACTGTDALSHAIESYWSIKSTDESREYSKESIKIIYPLLPKCVKNPTPILREKMCYAAYLAGKAINISFTTAPHAYSYAITSLMGIPHGRSVACALSFFFEKNLGIEMTNCNDHRGVEFINKQMNELCSLLYIDPGCIKKNIENYLRIVFSDMGDVSPPNENIWNKIINDVNIERLNNYPVKIISKPSINDFYW